MLLSTTLALVLSVAAVAAAHQNQARPHRAVVAKLSQSSVKKRDQFNGVPMTWYPTNTGPDACTGKTHSDNDWFVAMATEHFAGGSGCCGKKIRIDYNGKSTVATCVDECPTCVDGRQLDMTRGLLSWFVGPDTDEIYASWSYADDNDDGGDSDGGDDNKKPSPPPPPPKTTTTRHPAPPKTTSSANPKPTSSSVKHSSSSSSAKHSSSLAIKHSSSSSAPAPSASLFAPAGDVANAGSNTSSSDAGVGGSGSANVGSSPGAPVGGSASGDGDGGETKQVSGALTGTSGAISVAVSARSVVGAAVMGMILLAGFV